MPQQADNGGFLAAYPRNVVVCRTCHYTSVDREGLRKDYKSTNESPMVLHWSADDLRSKDHAKWPPANALLSEVLVYKIVAAQISSQEKSEEIATRISILWISMETYLRVLRGRGATSRIPVKIPEPEMIRAVLATLK